MRLLFEDLAFNDANADISIYRVTLPSAARRDVWFRFSNVTGNVRVNAYATRALAYAAAANTNLASATITPGASVQSVTLAPRSGATPDMTGLAISGVFAAAPADIYVWGYDSAPEVVTAENIKTRLLEFAAAGMPLEGIATQNIAVGDYDVVEGPVGIAIYPEAGAFDQSADSSALFALVAQIEIWVVVNSADSDTNAWTACRRYADAVRSILCDEHRTSYGEVLAIQYETIEGPVAIDGNGARFGARLVVQAHYHSVWRDDE